MKIKLTTVNDTFLQNQKAITLIALIITVIVLLILAGITINLTIGNNGIFKTAKQAAKNYTDTQNNELVDLDNFSNTLSNIINSGTNSDIQDIPELGTIIKKEDNINYTADGAGNIIPVPVGFSPIAVAEGQGTKDTGFVIKNNTDKNEFVWIPVEGMGYTYNRYDFGKQYGDYADYSEAMPSDEQTSVTTHGGYYIGRYEAEIANTAERTLTDKNTDLTAEQIEVTWGKALSQNSKHTYNYVTRDQAKGLSERVYTKASDNITSKLCSSYAWDTALKFIETKYPEYPTDSTGGNYNTETGGTGKLQKTGYHSVNNIYDMGGNVWEWTTESSNSDTESFVRRGASSFDSAPAFPASCRHSFRDVSGSYDFVAFRLVLFMQTKTGKQKYINFI